MSNRYSADLISSENKEIKVEEDLNEQEVLEADNDENEEYEEDESDLEESQIKVDYSHEHEMLAKGIYEGKPIDYVQMFYGDEQKKVYQDENEAEYAVETSKKREGLVSDEEAKESVKNLQYKMVLGTTTDITPEERRRLAWKSIFDPTLVMLAHQMYGITQDVDYSKPY